MAHIPQDTNDVELVLRKGKRPCAQFLRTECMSSSSPKLLPQIFTLLFDVRKPIADWESIDWINWIIAGGKTPEEFATEVKRYDSATKCGLVWTANFVAYRCRTCGISPCMSLCADCFKKGSHEGHDFNMFRSQAGGACDCGDDSVMKEQGFCVFHGSKAQFDIPEPPDELLCVAKAIIPRVIHRLISHLRKNKIDAIEEADIYIKDLLLKLTEMGAAMRGVLSDALNDPNCYSSLENVCESNDCETLGIIQERAKNYKESKKSMPHYKAPIDSDELKLVSDIISFKSELIHKTFLEELLFWTIVYEFPQKLVCFLLNMLPDERYKEAFAKTFVHHYSRISIMLCQSRNNDRNMRPKDNIHDILSNCVVHVSVQLFSNEELATKLCQKTQLLYVIVISLKYPIEGSADEDDISGILMSNPMQDPKKNAHNVVRCDHQILKDHWYWPIVSDLNNVLTHRPVAQMFMNDCALLDFWLELIMAFQGMNLNQRELSEHIEYENNAYYSAFSAELEICATPMWTLISHLKDSESSEQTIQIIKHVMHWLDTWFELIAFDRDDTPNPMQSTFHIPLHRYLSVFIHHAVSYQNVTLEEVLPNEEVLKQLLAHPLQTLVSFYEILCGLWVRNGLQIKGQAMTYIQCHFCNSMVDSDLFLIQQVATHVDSDWFIQTVFERFHVWDCLSLSLTDITLYKGFLESEQIMPMLESALTHIATLLSVHNNLGMTEEQVTRKEMVALLAMSDKTHSQLLDLLPEKCGTQSSQNSYFESMLNRIAEFKSPNVEVGGSLVQGQFYPKSEIWANEYDPIHVLLRAVHRRDYQSSMDRFAQFARQSGKFKSTSQPWPPFRIPPTIDSNRFVDPRRLLHSKVLHGIVFSILYKAVYCHDIPDQILALTIYLLDMAIRFPSPVSSNIDSSNLPAPNEVNDLCFSEWFSSNWIMSSLITPVKSVKLMERRSSMDGAVEEMDVDEDSSDSPEEDEYMSDEDEQPYEVHSPATSETGEARSLESSIQRPQLPTVSVPLALLPPPNSLTDVSSALVPLNLENRQMTSVSTHPTNPRQNANSIYLTPRPPLMGSDSADTSVATNEEMSVVASSVGPARLRSRNHRLRPVRPTDQRMLLLSRRRQGRVFETDNQTNQMELSSAPNRSNPHLVVRELMKALPPSSGTVLPINETIISLLIRLHSKLSGRTDSYKPTKSEQSLDSRIGDGPFFIEQLLNQFIQLNINGEEIITEIRDRIWTKQTPNRDNNSPKSEDIDREERRRKARERQQKLMAEFASKQKAFMENIEKENNSNNEWDEQSFQSSDSSSTDSSSLLLQSKEYECVICGQSGPTTNSKLFGQVVLLQSTSVLGHSTVADDLKMPNSEEEVMFLQDLQTLSKFMEETIDDFDRYFDKNSWLNSFNIGWVGGVHVQSCGHFIHLDCHKSYISSLRGLQQVQNRFGIEQGEYSCPLCRQMANSVLPINPCMGEIGAIVKCRPNDISAVASEILQLLSNVSHPDSEFLKLLGNAVEDLTKATGPQYRNIRVTPTQQSLFLFLCSISRTNLESDLLIKKSKSNACGAKKSCFVPLFHVLALNAKVVISTPYDNLWSQLTGLDVEENNFSLTTIEKEVPLFLKDVSSLLIQIFYALPLNVDKAYFTTVVQVLLNLKYTQCLAQLSCLMTESQRIELKDLSLKETANHFKNLSSHLGYVIDNLEHSSLYNNLDEEVCLSKNKFLSNIELKESVINICLPFLRLASMLSHHLYSEPFPTLCDDINEEFNSLIQFLCLGSLPVTDIDSIADNPITYCLNWTTQPKQLMQTWCQEYISFVTKSQIGARKLLRNPPLVWKRPSLLRLPAIYDQLFMFYHQRQCRVCAKVPKDPSICLICGTLVCMRESCCRSESCFEAVFHSNICGAGTAVYLACNSSTVIVIRGKRACVWGSVYLDGFGEEDRDLKRGKPLYLSCERYWILEQQWLTHSFDHTNKRWVLHKDTL